MKDLLKQKGYNLREIKETPLHGAFAVIINDINVWPWATGLIKSFPAVGVSCTGEQIAEKGDHFDITFNYSAYKKQGSLYVSASGGPGSISTPFECLRFTGYEIEITFWQFKDGYAKADNSKYYKEYVPLYEFFKSQEQALVKSEKISKSKFNKLRSGKTLLINNDFCHDWVRFNGLAQYMPETIEIFALPEIKKQLKATFVLPVVYKQTFWYWKESRRAKFKEPEYYVRLMKVYNSKFKALTSLNDLTFKEYGGIARNYYE